MGVCIGGPSALEAYRSRGRLVGELLDKPRTSKLDGCRLPVVSALEEELGAVGVRTRPYHLCFCSRSHARSRDDVRRHLLVGDLPRRSFVCVRSGLLISSPELLFVQLATDADLDDVDLALLGFELCGSYLLDPDPNSWDGMVNTPAPMTSVAKIARMIDAMPGRAGVKRATAVLRLVRDGSNSPMETVLALLFGLPRRLGGLGFGPVVMNRKVTLASGPRWVDIFFPEAGVGLEYKGRIPHSIEKVGRDDRRQNGLVGSGVTIINVWYEDLSVPHLFDQLVRDVAGALGVRLRIRDKGFAWRQDVLRTRLLGFTGRFVNE